MKKLLLLTKTLLAAALLCVGQNAWGESTTYVGSMYTYDVVFGTPNAATPTDINVQTDFTTDYTTKEQTTMSLVLTGSVLSGNQASGRTYAFSTAPTDGTVTFKSTFGVDAYTYACDYFTIRGTVNNGTEDVNSYAIVKSPTSLANATGTTTVLRIFDTNITASVYTPRSVLYGINVTIDIANQKVDYAVTYASKGSKGTVTALSTESGSVSVPDGYEIKSVADLYMPRNGDNRGCYYDNVAFYSAVPNSSTHSYTINAKAGSTVIQELATGDCSEGETYEYCVSKVVQYNGKFYVLDDEDNPNLDGYKVSYEMGDADEIKNINYTLDESIVGFTDVYTGGTDKNYSGGGYTNQNTKYAEATVNAGNYRAEIVIISKAGSGSHHRQEGVFVSDVRVAQTTGDTNGTKTLDFLVPTNGTNVFVRGIGTSNYGDNLDYVIIKKVSDLPAKEKIIVTDAGYATYVSNYNLDFTSATTKAYKVSVAEKGVATMTEVVKVPAKTPVLLYVAGGNGDGEDIPVTTDAVDAVTGNNLVAGTGAAVATTDGDYTNMILNNVSGIGFYFANGQTVAANRAYLHIDTDLAPATSARMAMRFAGDNITGVANVEAAAEAKAKEGKFIENGKLVIVKNGQKFNAAGAQVK